MTDTKSNDGQGLPAKSDDAQGSGGTRPLTDVRYWVCHPDEADSHITVYDRTAGGCLIHPHEGGSTIPHNSLNDLFNSRLQSLIERLEGERKTVPLSGDFDREGWRKYDESIGHNQALELAISILGEARMGGKPDQSKGSQ